MDRIMGDSTVLDDIPQTVNVAASYMNGTFAITPAAMEARFPNSRYGHCWIDTRGSSPAASARDWENGDKGGSLEQWVGDHNSHTGKKDAVIYCNVSTIPEVRQLTGRQILNQDYFLWIATLDGEMYTGEGVIACQRDGTKQTGGHWDRSYVFSGSLWLPTGTPVIKPNCQPLQRAVRTTADNEWGANTDQHCMAVYGAGTNYFPSGVVFAQKCVGTTADGIWGPKSVAALKYTVTNVQRALTMMMFSPGALDGVWGPDTESAYTKARSACHI
jgi:hypothetical protein